MWITYHYNNYNNLSYIYTYKSKGHNREGGYPGSKACGLVNYAGTLLKKISNHPNFCVTNDNIQKAERKSQNLNNYFEAKVREAKSIA